MDNEGENDVRVRQTDVAGNISAASTPLEFTLDTQAPNVTLNALGGLTKYASMTIGGTIDLADKDQSVAIYDGTTLLGTFPASGDGTWIASFTLSVDGDHALSARVVDVAGNMGYQHPRDVHARHSRQRAWRYTAQ